MAPLRVIRIPDRVPIGIVTSKGERRLERLTMYADALDGLRNTVLSFRTLS